MFLLQHNSSNLETSEALYCPHLRMMVGEIPDCLHNLLQKHHTAFHITKGLLSNIILYMLVFYSSVDCQNGDHSLQQCHIFRESDVDARIRTVQTLQACYNCLGLDHNSWQCYNKRTCKECGKKHHTLLHKPIGQTTSEGKAPTSTTVATQLTSDGLVK